MVKRTNRVAWGLSVVLAVVLGGCGAYAFTQFLSIRRGFQQWSLDEHLRDAAILGDDLGAVRLLLAQGARVNAPDERGSTALHIAVRSNKPAVVRVLLRHGARVNVANWYGETPLMGAADGGSTEIVRLLLHNGAAVNAQDRDGGTALTRARERLHSAIVQLLHQAGAKK